MKINELEIKRQQFRTLLDNLTFDNSLDIQTVDVAILDRDERFCDLYRKKLEQNGLTVFATKSEIEYIQFIGKVIPQKIVLSLELLLTNGCEICSHLKQKIGYYKIPICIIANDNSLNLDALKEKCKADKIISKNWGSTDELELLKFIKEEKTKKKRKKDNN